MVVLMPFKQNDKERTISLMVSRSTIDASQVDYLATVNIRYLELMSFLYIGTELMVVKI